MISEYNFRIKKTGEPYSECYCRHPELIENYDKAIADTKQIWQVHHRLECCFTYKFLVDMGLYYDVETGEVFESVYDAHRKTGINRGSISQVCLGKRKTSGGYHWQFV